MPYDREARLDSNSDTVRILNRATGTVEEEIIYGRAALAFAYRTRLGRALIRVLPHGLLSNLYGKLNRIAASRSKIPDFVNSLRIDATEAELPIEEYRSLDDFFCRRLKPEARPIDRAPDRFVSPADGRTMVFPRLGEREFRVKGCLVQLSDLLADPAEVGYYRDGSAIVVRLAPCDYHRFHFPESGVASEARTVPGRLHSVHPFALEAQAPSFRNKRTITHLETETFGRVTLVEVGAFAVGSIVQTFRPGPVDRGQEKGYFRFGGSTLVVLVPANRLNLDDDLVRVTEQGLETFVKMGTSIGSAVSDES
jgi:phosphatidylserine decarboxylase